MTAVNEESLEIMLDRLLPPPPKSPTMDCSLELLRDVIDSKTRTIAVATEPTRGGTQRIPLSRRPRSITPSHGTLVAQPAAPAPSVQLTNLRPETRAQCRADVRKLLDELLDPEEIETVKVRPARRWPGVLAGVGIGLLWAAHLATVAALCL